MLARQALGKRAEDGGGEGYAEGGGRDGHAGAGIGGVEEAGKQWKQRLGAVKLEKGAYAAKGNGRRSQRAGGGAVRLGGGFQHSG